VSSVPPEGECGDMLAAMLAAWFRQLAVESAAETAWVRSLALRKVSERGREALMAWLDGCEPSPASAASGRAALHGVYLAVCERLGPGVADRTLNAAIRETESGRSARCSPRDLL